MRILKDLGGVVSHARTHGAHTASWNGGLGDLRALRAYEKIRNCGGRIEAGLEEGGGAP